MLIFDCNDIASMTSRADFKESWADRHSVQSSWNNPRRLELHQVFKKEFSPELSLKVIFTAFR